MEESSEVRMITEAEKPHRITYVNQVRVLTVIEMNYSVFICYFFSIAQSFVELFGYVPEQVVGYTCSVLQGAETEQDQINALMSNVNVSMALPHLSRFFHMSSTAEPNLILSCHYYRGICLAPRRLQTTRMTIRNSRTGFGYTRCIWKAASLTS